MVAIVIADVLTGVSRWAVEQGEALALLRSMSDACVDAVVTDPPYSSGGAFRGDRQQNTTSKYVHTGQTKQLGDFTGDNRDQRGYAYWCALWLAEALRVAKPGAPICLFCDWRQLPVTTDALQAGGWMWRGIVPWNKTEAARPQMGRFRAQCEYVVWGSSGALPDRADVGCLPGFFEKYLPPVERFHVAGKPVEVMQEIVRICPPGGIVLDPFAGSATTVVAALLEGRSGIGFEADAGIAEGARNRCANVEAGNAPSPVVSSQLGLL